MIKGYTLRVQRYFNDTKMWTKKFDQELVWEHFTFQIVIVYITPVSKSWNKRKLLTNID